MGNLIHSVARVRALESKLLTSSHIDRMISAKSFAESYAVLDDLDYALDAARHRDSLDFESVLESGLFQVKKTFSQFSLEDTFSVATVVLDIQNCKIALKVFKKGLEADQARDLLLTYGSFSVEEVLNCVFESLNTSPLSDIISTGKEIESNVDMEKYIEESLFSLARKNAGNDAFLIQYLDLLESAEELKAFLGGGESFDSAFIAFPKWKKVLEAAEPFVTENQNFSALETAIDEYILEFVVAQARGKIDGYAPLFAFFWRKERSTRVIRSVLLAKSAGLEPRDIRNEFITFEF